MNDERTHQPATPPAEEADLRELLAAAGRRPDLPPEDLAALRESARAAWQRLHPPAAPRRRAAPWWLALAAAALLAVALGLGWWARRPAPPPAPLAFAAVERITGDVTWVAEGGRPRRLHAAGSGGALGAGAEVATAGGDPPSRLALRLPGGVSLRLDRGSRLRLAGPGEVELLAGALYVDSPGDDGPRRGLAVRTAHGVFSELGTQFEVRLLEAGGESVRLRVREGRVALARGSSRLVGDAGEELLLSGDAVARRSISSHDPSWGWVLQAAPTFAAEGATVRDFLDWLVREAGWRLELADAAAVEAAASARLHGSVAHLLPADALEPVLASAGLAHRLEDGRLVVFTPPAAAR